MTLQNVSADHLRQVLGRVEESAASERLMAAITYKEFDDVTQKDAAELYGWLRSDSTAPNGSIVLRETF
jgi:hypothetical protein